MENQELKVMFGTPQPTGAFDVSFEVIGDGKEYSGTAMVSEVGVVS